MSMERSKSILDRPFTRRTVIKGATATAIGVAGLTTVGCVEDPKENESGLKLEMKTKYAQMAARDIARAEDLFKDNDYFIDGFKVAKWYKYDPAEVGENAVFNKLKGADLQSGDVVIIDRVANENTRTGAGYSADQKPISRTIHLIVPREGKFRMTGNIIADSRGHWSGHIMFTDDFPQDVVGIQVKQRTRLETNPAVNVFGNDAVSQDAKDLEVVSITLAPTENTNSFEDGGLILVGFYAQYMDSPAGGTFHKGTALDIEPMDITVPTTLSK